MIEGKEEMPVLGKDGQIEFISKENAGKPEKKVKAEKVENSEKNEKSDKKKDLSEIFTDLDSLLQKMEGEESLEKSFAIYEKAVALLKEANSSIDRIEKQVRILDGEEGK
ncbi:exodeoxyribonuclease VII small subunit [Oribacterium parvum]|uniref:exodeoxyribonuclease VII small subunit n=1 Tax=Oribacterium parvum TaxID=1501329 RepID=UPI0028DC1B46|nr:exodeoxyribonuclease VII small subunit [Oribacterium parvum]